VHQLSHSLASPKSSSAIPAANQREDRLAIEFVAELHVKKVRRSQMRRSLSDIAPVLTVRDLSNYLKVSPSTIYRLIKTGQLPAFRVGSDWRFNVEEIDRWRVEREKNPGM
jgi:excisionase family DNA binding protein